DTTYKNIVAARKVQDEALLRTIKPAAHVRAQSDDDGSEEVEMSGNDDAIQRQTINGRKATVAYIKRDFTPVSPADAEMAKVVFDDGDVIFLSPATDELQTF